MIGAVYDTMAWENRLQKLMTDKSSAAEIFRRLAPDLSIVSPGDFAAEIKGAMR